MLYTPEHAPRPLTEEQEEQVHEYAMRICEEIGLDVLHQDARKLLEEVGQKVDGDRVSFERDFVMEQLAQAPHTFTLHARNPENTAEVGGGTTLWMGVGGPPFLSDLDEGRRAGTLEGHDTFIKLTQAASPLNCAQTGACEPTRMDVNTRHLDMEYSTLRWSDLPYTTYGTSGPKARDGIEMARIVHGGDLGDRTALMGVVNSVSPLIWDFRMVDAMIAWAESNQATIVTPFLLGGATAAVSVAGGLAQQVAEALSGVAIAQTIRPGAPCLYGSFFQATDMRTGAPALGTPESIFGVFAGAQMARYYGLPFRGGGGLCSSNAFDALKELGPGGLWLAAQHTMDHFREWQYISPLFITQDFTTWSAAGAEETAARANRRWKKLLETYEDPGIDADVDAELIAFMDRRKSEPPPDED